MLKFDGQNIGLGLRAVYLDNDTARNQVNKKFKILKGGNLSSPTPVTFLSYIITLKVL